MTEPTHGPGWWVASDGNWYPPEQHPDPAHRAQWATAPQAAGPSTPSPAPTPTVDPPADPTPPPAVPSTVDAPGTPNGSAGNAAAPAAPRRSRLPAVVGALTVVAVVVVGIVVFAATRSSTPAAAADPVVLEAVGDAGSDPFTTAVSVNEVTEFPAGVRLVTTAADPSGSVPAAAPTTATAANGGITIAATTPGLYGGSQNLSACDVEQLTAFLAANRPQAEAWAKVQGISVDEIDAYVDGLTPVVLTTDTWVTNHGFANGVATPRQSVLQAGTAVLVDDTGVPRTKCACGNPLLAPASSGFSLSTTTGTPWPGFATDEVTSMQAGTPVAALDLVDVDNGSRFSVPVGASQPGVVVAVTDDAVAGGDIVPSQILVSATGLEAPSWEPVFTAPTDAGHTGSIDGVAFGDGTFVAVGGADIYRSDATGRTWTQVATVPDILQDVAYGDGVWTAVGTDVAVRGPADGVVYQSTDATTWTEVATVPEIAGFGLGITSIDYGNGRWNAVMETDDQVSVSTGLTSTDGKTWTEAIFGTEAVANAEVRFDGDSWLAIGFTSPGGGLDDQAASSVSRAWTSTDGTSWSSSAVTPADLAQASIAAVDGAWVAAREPSIAGTADLATSTDGITWTVGQSLGLPGSATVAALAASPAGGAGPVPAGPTSSPSPVPTTAPTTTTTVAGGFATVVGTEPATISDAPTSTANPIGTLAPGTPVTVSCQVEGDFVGYPQSDNGSWIWNRLVDGTYVPDWYLETPKAGREDREAGIFIYEINPEIGAC